MELKSQTYSINKNQKDVFDYLTKVENFKDLMPENLAKFEVINQESFVFGLSGMPEIKLTMAEQTPYNKIILNSGASKLNFELIAQIQAISESQSDIQLTFNGSFNPMMSMMIKKPITNFIEHLAKKIAVS